MKKIIAILMLFISLFGYSKDLSTKVYYPDKNAIFSVVSTIIYGEKDAILVDAQFEKKYAKELVNLIKSTGKNLKYIFISHSDPDFYFGLDEIKKAFPNAKVLSTAQTAYLISATKDAKLEVWKKQLKENSPNEIIIPEAIDENKLVLEGKDIEIKQNIDDSAHSFLWIPSLKTVLGGIPVSNKDHLWMSDTRGIKEIDNWIDRINDMKRLHPKNVIPGHTDNNDFSPKILNWIKEYLKNYKTAVTKYKTSDDIVKYMEQKYPNLPGKENLIFGAKVFTGEEQWSVASPYPPIGRTITVDFGIGKFDLTFKDNKTMSFIGTSGEFKGLKDTVEYTAIEVDKNIFKVSWSEPNLGSSVVHIQDYNNNTVQSRIANKGQPVINLKGTITIKK